MKDKKIKEILLEYQKKRDIAEERLDYVKQKTYKEIPSLQIIDNKIKEAGLKMAKATISNFPNKNKLIDSLKHEFDDLKKEKEYILKKYNLSEEYFLPRYECKICNDTGYLQSGEKCNCFKQQLINEAYKMSNISRMLEVQNFNTLNYTLFSNEKYDEEGLSPLDNMENIYKDCLKFIEEFQEDNRKNLLFYGNTGLGKTFMCSCIAKQILDRGYTVIYQTAFKLFEIMGEYKFKDYDSHINKEDYENVFECDLLIIDDLGTEYTNNFTNNELFNIINTRLLNGKKTIISTNYTPKQLGEAYAQRIFSRIFDSFKMIKFFGKDLRWENEKDALSR